MSDIDLLLPREREAGIRQLVHDLRTLEVGNSAAARLDAARIIEEFLSFLNAHR